jgi:hypothetical protein
MFCITPALGRWHRCDSLSPHAGKAEDERWILEDGWDKPAVDDTPAVAGPPVDIKRENVVVVTGVSSGIGLATVKSLLEQGCHVFGRCGV